MGKDMEELYQERFSRYTTAMRNETPDMVPIRPFVAEFVATYGGYDCQQVTHDYQQAFDATCECAAAFDWDAVVPNMVYVWTGLTQAIGLKYYGIPGIDMEPDFAFQYREPAEEEAFMKPDEYDRLIEDPTAFLYEVWLPRVSTEISAEDGPTSLRNNLALVKGGMAMMQYLTSFVPQIERLKNEAGAPSAIAGILKSPFDIIADKLRGYIGLTMDMLERPDKVLAAAKALAPHLAQVALMSSGGENRVPVGFWMHRGCVPFVKQEWFDSHYWPTLKPVIEELWANGHQTLFYAEGDWDAHLETFRELPDKSIVYHVDRGDVFKAHEVLGDKFCISGGIPNYLLSFATPEKVRQKVKGVIEGVAGDGGYILDASAIVQNDAKVENMQALTDAGREFGLYSDGEPPTEIKPPEPDPDFEGPGLIESAETATKPGVCMPWEVKRKDLGDIPGDEDLCRQVWEDVESLAYMYIWQCLVSF